MEPCDFGPADRARGSGEPRYDGALQAKAGGVLSYPDASGKAGASELLYPPAREFPGSGRVACCAATSRLHH